MSVVWEVIVRNIALCLLCFDEIESIHRHDLVSCKCGNLFVDGGTDYLRRGYMTSDWEELSVETDVD